MHEEEREYLVLLDHHDDVLVCDSADAPAAAEFYQVKTKRRGIWTITAVLKRPSNKLSFIGKLYDHVLKFSDGAKALVFVSNTPVQMRLATGADSTTMQQVLCSDLHPDELAKITRAIREEHELGDDPDLGQLLRFELSSIPLLNYDTQAKGVLVDYLEGRMPGTPFRTRLIYNTLIAELRRKNNVATPLTAFSELALAKGISREDFEAMLRRVTATPDPNAEWRIIEQRLDQAGHPPMQTARLKGEYIKCEAQLIDQPGSELLRAFQWITVELTNFRYSEEPVHRIIEQILTGFRGAGFDEGLYPDQKVTALILIALQRYESQ